ncbi:unnamed protein product [Lampetra planeri]
MPRLFAAQNGARETRTVFVENGRAPGPLPVPQSASSTHSDRATTERRPSDGGGCCGSDDGTEHSPCLRRVTGTDDDLAKGA